MLIILGVLFEFVFHLLGSVFSRERSDGTRRRDYFGEFTWLGLTLFALLWGSPPLWGAYVAWGGPLLISLCVDLWIVVLCAALLTLLLSRMLTRSEKLAQIVLAAPVDAQATARKACAVSYVGLTLGAIGLGTTLALYGVWAQAGITD